MGSIPVRVTKKRHRHSKAGVCVFFLCSAQNRTHLRNNVRANLQKLCSARGSHTSPRSARGIAVARRYTKRLVQTLKLLPHYQPAHRIPVPSAPLLWCFSFFCRWLTRTLIEPTRALQIKQFHSYVLLILQLITCANMGSQHCSAASASEALQGGANSRTKSRVARRPRDFLF